MKTTALPPGKYILAVSGGVDSVVLLDLLAQCQNLTLIVAHFDHGIRPDSAADARFVAATARRYGLPFVMARGELGPEASEATARKARYAFLEKARVAHGADALITAHHQDDVVETVIINLLRGTGWRGLVSLRDADRIRRPLLGVSKSEITAYAQQHRLEWHEDSTNRDARYLRNRVRHEVLPMTDVIFRQELLALVGRQGELRGEIESLIEELLQYAPHTPSPPDTEIRTLRVRHTVSNGEGDAVAVRPITGAGVLQETASLEPIAVSNGVQPMPSPGLPALYDAQRISVLVGQGWQRASPTALEVEFPRVPFICLPNPVAKELLLAVVYKLTGRRVEQAMLQRMLWFVKTAHLYKTLQVSGHIELYNNRRTVVVRTR